MDQEILYRTGTIYRDVIDEESRTIELSFSSDAAVERVFGNEVLEHTEDSMDSERSVFIYFSFPLAGRLALVSLPTWSGAMVLWIGFGGTSRSIFAEAGWGSGRPSGI